MERTVVAGLFFVAFLFCALITKTHTDSCNDFSRIAAIESLVDRGTFRIDDSQFGSTCDRYRYAGHFYSDKEPLLILMGAGVALALRPFGVSLTANFPLSYYLITLFTVGVCFALAAVYLYIAQRLAGITHRIALIACGLMVFATPVLTWATVLANHVPCGAAALMGTVHAILAARGSGKHVLVAGVFFSVAVAFDAAAILFYALPIVLLWRKAPSLWFALAIGSAPLLIGQALFNVAYSGSAIPPAMNASVWNYPGSFFRNHALSFGMLGSVWSYVDYAKYLAIGDKGLITYSPLVLVAVYGVFVMWREGTERRRIAAAIAAACALFLIFTLIFTDDHSAGNYGERRYVDFLPLLCISLGPALAALRSPLGVWSVRVVVVVAIVMEAIGTVSPWTGNPGFLWNLDRFRTIWMHAPVIAAVDVAVCLAIIATAVVAIRPVRQCAS